MEPGKKVIVTAVSLQMRAEIIKNDEGIIKGELHSQYLDAPYVFPDLVNMIYKMEEIFDTNGFPQAFLSPRSFKGGKRGVVKHELEGSGSMDLQSQDVPGSVKCTFEITVGFRQNATWQGRILWVEKNVTQSFRSVLEMLKLMDEALSEGNESAKHIDWGTDK